MANWGRCWARDVDEPSCSVWRCRRARLGRCCVFDGCRLLAGACAAFDCVAVEHFSWAACGEPRAFANQSNVCGKGEHMQDRHTVILAVLVCSLLSEPASAQSSTPGAGGAGVGVTTTALVACIRHDISKRCSTASADTSPLALATSVELTCRPQMQDLERATRKDQGDSFDRTAFEREWRAAIAVGVQEVLTGTSVRSLDLQSGLKSGQANQQFKRILRANVEAKRVAAQTCLFSSINKYAVPAEDPAESVARTAIGLCKQNLDQLNHASCLQVTGNNCTVDLTRVNTLQMHIKDWGSTVTAAVASMRSERQSPR